ncbi:MAG: ferrochelatase [Rhodospirillales bacterium]|nr:ferrochelatase [Rhodospirillales bacterium]
MSTTERRIAVVLFNLGGPDRLEAVRPFLANLFADPAIIGLPALLRRPLAWFIARRRAPIAREIYARIGGGSPLLPLTEEQGAALAAALARRGHGAARTFVAMRYWHPMSEATAAAVARWRPEEIVLLPLYPQFSTTTTGSSLSAWAAAARRAGLDAPTRAICCYPTNPGFIAAIAAATGAALDEAAALGGEARLLFSAHGLPERVIARGDPYQAQVEATVAAVMARLGEADHDHAICYQSRVGPLQWIGPAIEDELRRAADDGVATVIVVPTAFVSEHSETLVELDIEYRALAASLGIANFIRVATVGTAGAFIEGLAELVIGALERSGGVASGCGKRWCAPALAGCPTRTLPSRGEATDTEKPR